MADSNEWASEALRRAVALRYERGRDRAPQVVASGRGRIAEAIIQRAREAGVPLMEDPDLVALLDKIPVGGAIPPALYQAVAEVLVYVYLINRGYSPAETASRIMGPPTRGRRMRY